MRLYSLGNGKNSAYYFWGKNAWKYYSEEIDHEETVTGSEGQDSIVYYYKPDPTAIRYIYPLTDTPWRLKSQGQVLTGELTLAPEYAVGNGATGRYAETAQDNIGNPSKGVITFGAKTSGEPYTAAIETTQKFAGPFDVVVYVGNGNGSGAGILEIQTSADGENWESIGELTLATTQRYWKKNRAAYEGTDEVFVRVAQTGRNSNNDFYQTLGDAQTLGKNFSGYNNKWNWMDIYAHAHYTFDNFAKLGLTASYDAASSIGEDATRFSLYPASLTQSFKQMESTALPI